MKALLLLLLALPAFAEVADLNGASNIAGHRESATIYVLNSGERVLVIRKSENNGSYGTAIAMTAVLLPPLVSTPPPPLPEPQSIEDSSPRPERQVTYGPVPEGWRQVGTNIINGYQQKIIERGAP